MLPIRYRIKYKINMLTWKALRGKAPGYLSEMLKERKHYIDVCSGCTRLLVVPKTNLKMMGDKAFSSMVPRFWNQLPKKLRMDENLQSFKIGTNAPVAYLRSGPTNSLRSGGFPDFIRS